MSLIQDAKTSLGAINTWMGVIQANLEGTRKIGYKVNQLSFTSNNNVGPSGTNISSRPGATSQNSILPSASLTISQTSHMFEQGDLIETVQVFDTGINGEGFFYLADSLEADANVYISRDGEFHLDASGYLVNRDGLYVLDITANVGNSSNVPPLPPLVDPGEPGEWDCRERLRVTNTSALTAPAGSYVTFTFNANQYIANGDIQADLDDLRITYWDGTDWQILPVNIDMTDMNAVVVTFQTVADIAVGANDDNYFFQHCNPEAGPGPLIPSLTYSDNFNNGAINTPFGTYVSSGATGVWEEGNATDGFGDTVGGVAGAGACGITGGITVDANFELLQRFDGVGENRMILDTALVGNPDTWTDYRVSVTAGTLTHNNGGMQVFFRWDETTDTGYRFTQTAGGITGDPNAPAGPPASRRIEKIVGGAVQAPPLFEDDFVPANVSGQPGYAQDAAGYNTGSMHAWETDIDVEVRSNNIIIYQGGVPFFNFTDTVAPILQGTIGVGTFNQAAFFDDLNVVPLPLGSATVIGNNGAINVGGMFGGSPGTGEWQEWVNENILLVRPENPQGLVYSQYGSTVFDLQKSNFGFLKTGSAGTEGMGLLKVKALENSNASFTEFLPMLSSAQKLFAAISKLISIHNGQVDEVNQLIR